MDIFTILFWVVSITLVIISLFKAKKETVETMKKSKAMMGNMIGEIIAIIFIIGLVLTFIPAFVAFPLVGSFVKVGASIVPAVAFLTTLTMVGIVTFPLEKKEFGFKFALLRNVFSFVAAILIAALMGVML